MRTACLFAMLGCALGQTPAFEVASIKPAARDGVGRLIHYQPGGRLEIVNLSLKDMIADAWGVQSFQIAGGPPWMNSARYDISAKAETAAALRDMKQMLQALLQDRFGVAVRQETREVPVYAIVLARKDGKLGPQMIEVRDGCESADAEQRNRCGQVLVGPQLLRGFASPVKNLAELSQVLERPVIDRTGLTGSYDMKVEWSAAGADGGPSIFTALQEQLGLKLESVKGPVEMLVIEKAEKPTEN